MQKFLRNLFIGAYDYSVHDLDGIKKCLYLNKSKNTVYSGAQARMVSLTKSNPKHRAIYDWLAGEVYYYLNNSNVETHCSFDDWHYKICRSFIEKCNAVDIDVKYGMAQKFLNLLMKYVYCFKDADTLHKSKFEYCHFILDGYTYFSPFKSYIGEKKYGSYTILTPFYARQVFAASTDSFACWSKLSYEEYINIQGDIRVYLTDIPLIFNNVKHLDTNNLATVQMNYPLTAFETEFFVW
jgi:hypothetical protein